MLGRLDVGDGGTVVGAEKVLHNKIWTASAHHHRRCLHTAIVSNSGIIHLVVEPILDPVRSLTPARLIRERDFL